MSIKSKILFVGDMGAVDMTKPPPLIERLKEEVRSAQAEDTIVVLGDNLYPRGLPPANRSTRLEDEARLRRQLSIFDEFKGKLVYLLGNHDWNKGKANGLSYALEQEKFINDYFSRSIVYPPGGAPGPVAIELNEWQVLVVLNTQWWVQRGPRSLGDESSNDSAYKTKFFELLQNQLKQHHSKRQVIIAGHHPLLSNALHGGKFDFLQHLFPLRALNSRMWIPLPIAGSLYPLYRKWIGTREDLSHRLFRRFRKAQLALFEQFQNLIYVSGHDHNLQYFNYRHNHFVVSGAGSKIAYVKPGGKSSFVKAAPGFVILESGTQLRFFYYESTDWHNFDVNLNGVTPTQL